MTPPLQEELQEAWLTWRRRALHRDYRRRREGYQELARQRGLSYSEADSIRAVRERMRQRGHLPRHRKPGEVHTFAFIPRIGWHDMLYRELAELGPVDEYDYVAQGYRWEDFSSQTGEARRRMNDDALQRLKAAHEAAPIDWVFVYASGIEIYADFVRKITEGLGLPTVNLCLDDKHSWEAPIRGGQRGGQIDIAAAFDISWTSASVACEWYLCEGARPLYMPEGFDATTFKPSKEEPDVDVSFVGGAYGYRPAVLRELRKAGVAVKAFGAGWGQTLGQADYVRLINRSRINLGLGGIGYSELLTNVKGRDFEVPGTGGGMYLTSFNADLGRHLGVGTEIACYGNRDEMVEQVRYYLKRPEEAMALSGAGRRRCLSEHRWLHRFTRICQVLEILDEPEPARG